MTEHLRHHPSGKWKFLSLLELRGVNLGWLHLQRRVKQSSLSVLCELEAPLVSSLTRVQAGVTIQERERETTDGWKVLLVRNKAGTHI